MLKSITTFLLLFFSVSILAQTKPHSYRVDKLTVEKTMRDPKWIGTSPSVPQWSADGRTIFFNWNPDKATSDSLYFITLDYKTPVKASVTQKQNMLSANALSYNKARTAYTYSKDGDIFYIELKTTNTKKITETTDSETNPLFSFNDSKIVFTRNQNLYAWNITTGETRQLTNIKGSAATSSSTGGAASRATINTTSGKGTESGNQQEDWLKKDQLQNFEVLRLRKEKKDQADAYTKSHKTKRNPQHQH